MKRQHCAAGAIIGALLGGTVFATALPAAAQPSGSGQDSWRGDSSRGGGRDWVNSHDPMDSYDMWLQRLREEHDRNSRRSQSGAESGRGNDAQRAMMERQAQMQFERGYRAGREEERRRRATQESGGESARSTSSGRGTGSDFYWVIPDILPDTRSYRGMQDYALIPDYSRSMDWLLFAAQGLREAVQAMAQQPPGEARDRAMDRAREALLETQQAMVQLSPERRTR